MKKYIATFFFLCLSIPAAADETLLKTLAINRSLLAEYELERMKLEQAAAVENTETLARQLENSRYKIQALNEESEKLRTALTAQEQAQEFMRDLLLKKTVEQVSKRYTAPKTPSLPAPVVETADQMHERALRLVAEQKLDKAVKLYEELVLSNPDDDQAYVIMGHCYILMGRYDKAEQAFQNAVHIDPANIQEIVPFYQNIILQNPGDDKAYANLGYAYLIVGDVVKTREAYHDALAINPENERALEGMQTIERITAQPLDTQ